MTNYRIIEVIEYDNDIYYLLQIRTWLFFWETVEETNYTSQGKLTDEIKFTSRQGAKEYYRKYYMKSKTTIVEEN